MKTLKPTYEMLEQRIKELENSLSEIDSLKAKVKLNNSFLETLFDAIPSPIFYKDKDGTYLNCNDAFSNNILGIAKDEIIGKTLYDFPDKIPKKNADIYYQKDKELLQTTGIQFYNADVKCSDNVIRHYNFYKATFLSENDEALGVVGIMMDTTKLRKQEEELRTLATIDSLTKLFNRRHFTEVAQGICVLSKRNSKPLCILMIDIDNFKKINDTYGHFIGDNVLTSLSNKLLEMKRTSDIVCRWGGEEFIILLPETDIDGALKVANKIRQEIQKPIVIKNTVEISYTLSIGVSQSTKEDKSLENPIHRADIALYQAKDSGKNKVCIN